MLKKAKKVLRKNEKILLLYDSFKKNYFKYFYSDKKFIQKMSKKRLGKEVNLKHPKEFNEKMQWLKLYWHDDLATQCADKLEVRQYVQNKIGRKYLNDLIEVYTDTQEINLDKLPRSFVLKGTHGSGFVFVCEDKHKVDWETVFISMRRWLNQDYYYKNREWVYKNIKPRIICERYISESNGPALTDYKFFCFNGDPKYCQVIRGRGENETIDFYDHQWKHMPFTGLRNLPNSYFKYEKPKKYEEMLYLAKKLSTPFPFVRVDFYYVNDTIIFGELTFFPQSGFGSFYPKDWNERIGSELNIKTN